MIRSVSDASHVRLAPRRHLGFVFADEVINKASVGSRGVTDPCSASFSEMVMNCGHSRNRLTVVATPTETPDWLAAVPFDIAGELVVA
jgi:hypothetical protein